MNTFVIDPHADVAPYEQLRRQLIEQITAGQLPAETRLPAVRRLAAELALAPGTVARAYKELEAEGYLETRGRNGTVVASYAVNDPTVQAQRITAEYVTTMLSLGYDAKAIQERVLNALTGS
ncbi:MAG: GntR family transcriptional regulator [Micrococcaceae bacterium]|nr:GntR family transcriptional regulator [Micrococcaceae bacterium]